MIRPLMACLVVCAALIAITSTVMAAPKVALTTIDGDTSGDVRDAVAAALDSRDLTLIGEKETNRAFDKLGVSDLSEKDARKLATALEADAIVQPSLNKKDGAKVLKFKLFVNGKKAKGFSMQFKNAKSPKFKTMLRDKMVEKISNGPDGGEAEAEEPVATKTKKGKGAKAEVDDEDPITKTNKGKGEKLGKTDKAEKAEKADKSETDKSEKTEKADKADKADKGESSGDSETAEKTESTEKAGQETDDDDAVKPKKKKVASADDEDIGEPALVRRMDAKHSANRVAIRLDVGASVANRTLKFNSRPNFPERPSHFKSAPVAGGRFEVEMYPIAFLNPKSVGAILGFAAEYDKTISMSVGSEMLAKRVPIDQQHYEVGLRLRIPFGGRSTSPTATLGIDYGRRTFKANRVGLAPGELDLPDTDYKFFAPSFGFRIPIGRVVALIASGEAMLVTDAGPIQTAESYGKAKVFGFAGQGGFDIVLGNRFALRFTGEVTQVGFTFIGAGGAEANGRDGDPGSKDVGGAADRSVGGVGTLAVLY